MCAGLAATARIDHREKHRSPTRNTPQPRAFLGTDAKEFPINDFLISLAVTTPDAVLPTVSVTAPAKGTTVSGSVSWEGGPPGTGKH